MFARAVDIRGIGASRTIVRLLLGLIRRNMASLLVWIWILPMIVRTLSSDGASVTWSMAASMSLAFLLGLTGENIGCREHRVLPVNDRDLWVARWLYATLLVPSYLLILKGAALGLTAAGGNAFITGEALLLSTLYDVTYAGATLALTLLVPSVAAVIGRRVDRLSLPIGSPQRKVVAQLTVISVFIVVPFFFLLGFGGPFLFARDLPTRLADLSLTSAVLLMTGLMMSIAAFLWTPPRGGSALPQRAVSRARVRPPQPGVTDRLTGVHSVMWTHITSTFVVTGVALAVVIAVAPFLDNAREPANARVLSTGFLILAHISISLSSIWAPWARSLKVLPVSTNTINALFVVTPLVTWLVVWPMMLLVHAAIGLPIQEELGPLVILACAGLCALSHAVAFRLTGSVLGHLAATSVSVLPPYGAVMVLQENPDAQARLLLLMVGLASLTIAAFINHRTLTRSTSSARAYRAPVLPSRP